MELHDAIDKFFDEVEHLDRILIDAEPDPQRTELALSVAKRARSTSTILVRALAERRDQNELQPGGTSE